MHFAFNHPQASAVQARLARMPRWGWIAILIGVILPIVIVGISLVIVGLLSGFLVLLAVAALLTIAGFIRRIFTRPIDDGRKNVRIVVHSARIIDP